MHHLLIVCGLVKGLTMQEHHQNIGCKFILFFVIMKDWNFWDSIWVAFRSFGEFNSIHYVDISRFTVVLDINKEVWFMVLPTDGNPSMMKVQILWLYGNYGFLLGLIKQKWLVGGMMMLQLLLIVMILKSHHMFGK